MSKRTGSRFFIFIAGMFSGIVLMFAVVAWAIVKAPSWLVIDEGAHEADIAVVLGGGGGSRLRAGLSLYNTGLVDRLLLVDEKKEYWKQIQDHLCADCITEGKDVVILDGSVNTFTDASLVAEYCGMNDVDSILVVTDPYHTRRASLIFASRFKGSNVDVSILSTGDYAGKLSPDDRWWRDDFTSKVIWGEISRILIFYLRGYEFFTD